MTHPVEPGHENTYDVFLALLRETLPHCKERDEWYLRYLQAQDVEAQRRAYDREWDDSLLGVTRFGQ